MSLGQWVERRIVSILFADLVGFTALSETLDAEDVAAVQERYFSQVRETIGRHGGRLEKFIGDAAMAVFGLPRTRDDDAERAVRAGLALIHAVEALASQLGLAADDLRLRVGVNSGEVAYSTADGEEWRVSGDAVNVAARLQAAAAPGRVLIGEPTALSVAESIALDPPVELELKGKSEPVRGWSAVSVLPHRSRERALGTLHAPLIGREPEMAALEGALERARHGATESHVVVAPPGVGKSRLIDEFVRRATAGGGQAGLVILLARLRPEAIAPSSLAAQLLAGAGSEREFGERLVESGMAPVQAADLAHEVAGLIGGSADGEARPAVVLAADDRSAQFRRWIEALDGLAGAATALWLIEDLHWAGGDVLAFVEQAARSPAPHGRLLLATARPTLLESLDGLQGQSAPVGTMELPLLPASDATELVRALVGEALPAQLEAALVERSDGNALFIEELLRSWVSLGTLRLDPDGQWQMTASPDDISLPHTVRAIYAGQLDDLPQGARLLARRAAVAGRHVPRDSLESLELGEVEENLRTVRRRALLADGGRDPLTGAELRYRHALLRDAGYASLSRAERARFHARLAQWYQDVAGPRAGEVAEQVAGHYAAALENSSRLAGSIDAGLDAAGARRLAIEWYERAADQALSGAAHETTRSHLRRALELLADKEPLLRGRLLLRLGEATAYTADMDEGAQLMEEARALLADAYARTQDPAERSVARAGYAAAAAAIGRVWVQQIRFDDAIRLADETLAAIGGPEDAGVARLLGLRAWVKAAMLDAVRDIPTDLQRGLEIARAAADRQLELDILHWQAMARGELGIVEESDWDAVKALAVELGDWSRAVKAMRSRAAWLVDDDAAQVWALADEAEAVCRRRGLDEDLAWIDYLRSEVGFVSGDWSTALAAGRRAIELGERNAYHRAVVRTWHVLLPIAEARGERELVEHAFRWFESRRDSLPDSAYARVMYWVFEARFIRAGLRPPAVPDAVRLLPSFETEPGGPSWVSAIEDVVEAWLAAGMLAAVADALERTDRAISEAPETSSLGRGAALYLRARLNAVEAPGSPEASRLARAALEHFRLSRAPWWIHKSLSVLSSAGESSAAESAELGSIAESLGVGPTTSG